MERGVINIPSGTMASFACPPALCGCAGMVNFNVINHSDQMTKLCETMEAHVDAGITAFDVGDIYPGVEETVGVFIRRRKEACKEKDVVVTTKFVPNMNMLQDIDLDHVRRVMRRSCNRLHVSRLDLVQMHWWDYSVARYIEVGKYLMALKEEGLIAHIGTTNMDTKRISEMRQAGVPVEVNQAQYSLVDRRAETEMLPLCVTSQSEADFPPLYVLAYGVLCGGFLTDAWLGQSEPEKPPAPSMGKYLAMIRQFGGWALFQELLQTCRAVADDFKATIAQVAIAWVKKQPGVGGVIVGARQPKNVPATHAAVFKIDLTDQHLQSLRAVLDKASGPTGDCYAIERDPSTPSGAALAPWTNVGNLGAPSHMEEVKRRYAQLVFETFPQTVTKAAAEAGFRPSERPAVEVALSPSARVRLFLEVCEGLLRELRENFQSQETKKADAEPAPCEGGGLSEANRKDVDVLALSMQLRIAQAQRLVEELAHKEAGEGDAQTADKKASDPAAAAIDGLVRYGGLL